MKLNRMFIFDHFFQKSLFLNYEEATWLWILQVQNYDTKQGLQLTHIIQFYHIKTEIGRTEEDNNLRKKSPSEERYKCK